MPWFLLWIIDWVAATRIFGDSFNCSNSFPTTHTHDGRMIFNQLLMIWETNSNAREDTWNCTANREIIRSDKIQLPCGPDQGLIYRFVAAFSRSLQYKALLLLRLLSRLLLLDHFLISSNGIFTSFCLSLLTWNVQIEFLPLLLLILSVRSDYQLQYVPVCHAKRTIEG